MLRTVNATIKADASNCPAPTSGNPPSACAGGQTLVTMTATINGNRYGNRQYRFEILSGPFFWVFPSNQTQGGTISGNTLTTNTDHEGRITAVFQVNQNVGTQLGIFRVTDVANSTNRDFSLDWIAVRVSY